MEEIVNPEEGMRRAPNRRASPQRGLN